MTHARRLLAALVGAAPLPASMKEKNLTAAQTRALLTSTSDDLGAAGRDTCYGFGRVNLARAAA